MVKRLKLRHRGQVFRHRGQVRISLRDALDDPALLGNILRGKSWNAWRTLLIAAMGGALTTDERVIFQQLTGRDHEPLQRVEELVGVIGRRGGKSRAISALATYIAGLCHHPSLVPGERGIVLCVAPDQEQAKIVLDYVEANFRSSPILRQLVEARTLRALRLTNRIDVEVRPSSFRTLRGPSYVAVICDESAFWFSENSANPDAEILAAIRPGLATTGGPLFLISSPYARKGELFRLWKQHYGPDGDPLILVAQAPSKVMNPSLPQSVVDRAYERDPISAKAEYGAEFRTDLEAFASLDAVQRCVSPTVLERAPQLNIAYVAFVDPSGGSQDSFTLSVGHYQPASQVSVIDCVRECRPPFSPEQVTEEFSNLLKSYRLHKVTGDRYGGEWPREQFAKFGIRYEVSAKPKSGLYQDLLALINSRRVSLLDHPKLINQIVSLERRTSRGSNREQIDHPQVTGAHDDLANSVAGVASLLLSKSSYNLAALGDSGYDDAVPTAECRKKRAENAEYNKTLMQQYGAPVRLMPREDEVNAERQPQ